VAKNERSNVVPINVVQTPTRKSTIAKLPEVLWAYLLPKYEKLHKKTQQVNDLEGQ